MSLDKLDLIVKNSEARLCLMDDTIWRFKVSNSVTGFLSGGSKWPSKIRYERSESIGRKGKSRYHQEYMEPNMKEEDIAFLQYTSGSTVRLA